MATENRRQRLASLLHREIATTVQRELRDPRLGFITITRVELSGDLHLVKAYWTMLGTDTQRRLAEAALESAKGFIQRAYGPVVHTRLLPHLSFAYDQNEDRRNSLDGLIRQARASDTDGGANPEPPTATPRPGEEAP